ncbi:MAG: NAD-dependent epimerase/dehydratase family protein [Bacteroidota bacterium]|nr:NAD-dependent epimerase/dehydratase family protein [Bacteroidota bacterium]
MKKKVLVTGATGLLGANIVCELNKQNYKVKIISRKGSSLKSLDDCEYELYEGNITDYSDLEKAIEGCDYVIHAAARTTQSPNKLSAYTDVNITTTDNLMQLCEKHKIKKFIFVSSTNTFSNGTKENPGDETGEFMPWLKGSGYAYSKYIAHQKVLEKAKNENFPGLVVAPSFMIGPRDSKPSSGKLLLLGLNNRVVFHPSGGKSFVDVEYAAEAIVNSIEKGKVGESYLISGINKSYREFFRTVNEQTGKKKILVQIPLWLLKGFGQIFSFFEKLFKISLPLNIVNQRLLCLDNYFSNNKAVRELGLKKTSLEESINKAVKWFENKEK